MHERWRRRRGYRTRGLTQTGGDAAEVAGDSAAAASVALTDATLIQGVGGEQHSVTPDRLSGKTGSGDDGENDVSSPGERVEMKDLVKEAAGLTWHSPATQTPR